MAEADLVLFTEQQRRVLGQMFRSFGRTIGGGDLNVIVGPDGQLSVSRSPRSMGGLAARDHFALVRLTGVDGTDAWKYVGEEVIGNDPDADPPTWTVKSPGRTWGVESEDEGLVVHPAKIEGLETTASGADAVYVVRRVALGSGSPRWVIVGAAGDSLPAPGSEYMVLQLQGSPLVPVWDHVRAH